MKKDFFGVKDSLEGIAEAVQLLRFEKFHSKTFCQCHD